MSDQVDTKENLAYNYCLLETAVENITADYFNAITPILTNAISNGFDQLKEEHPKNKKFIDKEHFKNSSKYIFISLLYLFNKMFKLKIKSILMAYNKGSDIIDQAEANLKSSFSMDGQLFKRDEYET